MSISMGCRRGSAVVALLVLGACGGSSKTEVSAAGQPEGNGANSGAAPGVGATGSTAPGNDPVVDVASQSAVAPQADLVTGGADAVVTTVTFAKSRLLGRTFLYGSDIQYSGKPDGSPDSVFQSLALGHVQATFRIVGATLQLLADGSTLFESDVNRPERLLAAWPIVADRGDLFAVEIRSASPALVTTVQGLDTAPARTSWVRSLEYVREQQLLLVESSIEAPDGTVWQFYESLFPRELLVADDFAAVAAGPAEAAAQRYRFLTTGAFWVDGEDHDRVQNEFATRWDLRPGRTIEWYATPNTPDEYLREIENGVEGWNRYFQAMWKKDAVVFKGKLPKGIKIGDPRFNVVNWDHVADAPAAYESQAYDPTTGVQSHSLVYLPYAWINIGKQYWEGGRFSEKREAALGRLQKHLEGRTFLGKPLALRCKVDPTAALSSLGTMDPDTFARTLLRGTLFHEVGHAMGLAHNFKASLSYDPAKPLTFSTSIMDYNQYEIERGAFTTVEGSAGPLLEYDRQILSVLYNGGKDVKPSDPVLPACEDGEADNVEGGVDPLCLRYDAGSDPSAYTLGLVRLLEDAKATLGPKSSLPVALARVTATLGDPAKLATWDDVEAAAADYANALYAATATYTTDGAASVRDMASTVLPGLYVEQAGVVPEGVDLVAYRSRVFEGVSYGFAFDALPKASHDALAKAIAAFGPFVEKTPAYRALDPQARAAQLEAVLDSVNAVMGWAEAPFDGTLATRVRTTLGRSLKRVATAPFVFTTTPARLDYEQKAIALLEAGLTTKVAGATRPLGERTAYAQSLLTFGDTDAGQASLDRVITAVNNELAAAPDARSREQLRALLKTLSGG
jgi:hypothetical protein